MAKYKVVKAFTDLQDGDYVYRAGDPFPRNGKTKNERIEELSTKNNKRNEVLIEKVEVDGVPSEFPVHTGGGYYELSNGDKVQGKDKAHEAEQALKN